MAFKFNPFTGNFDQTITSLTGLNGVVGTAVEFPLAGFIMNDGVDRWRITIDTLGDIVTTKIEVAGLTGQSYGMFPLTILYG